MPDRQGRKAIPVPLGQMEHLAPTEPKENEVLRANVAWSVPLARKATQGRTVCVARLVRKGLVARWALKASEGRKAIPDRMARMVQMGRRVPLAWTVPKARRETGVLPAHVDLLDPLDLKA